MIKLKTMTMRNFLSIGNVTQSINFADQDLVLVLGENLDLGGNDSRNGVGKSAIVNALSYVLFGSALTFIKKDNLINATNSKGMLVTLTFDVDNRSYTIERGRKPGVFKFIKDGQESEDGVDEDSNESQGENRHTQAEIERILGMSHDLFKHILALNTYVEPFLSLGANNQRVIIEQLLGVTKLSEKAEKLKDEIKLVKDSIKEEEFRISATISANSTIQSNIDTLVNKSMAWVKSKTEKIASLESSLSQLAQLDIEREISNHNTRREIKELTTEYNTLVRDRDSLGKEINEYKASLKKLEKVLTTSTEKICPTCNQSMDSQTHKKVHDDYIDQQKQISEILNQRQNSFDEANAMAETVKGLIPSIPTTFYKTLEEAYNHKTTVDTIGSKLLSELETENPYEDQIASLKKDGLKEIDYTKLNDLAKLKDHQEFLLKLLINKDSIIRKSIIDQNLGLLNQRLSMYLTDIGLPHSVKFRSDLEVEISLYGKDFDFDNLSRGERTRLILSLSWAFRDVFENMTNKINLLFIDELIDNGLDSNGVDASLAILKKMSRDNQRSIYLISHRDELVGRVSNVLKVIKTGGFTEIDANGSATK